MDTDLIVETANHRIIWRYRRHDDNEQLTRQLTLAIEALDEQPFVLLIDLRAIRYILPDDRRSILFLYEHLRATPPLETVYLVDLRSYNRMQLLITLNHFPNPELVFKYEADALDYLEQITLKHFCKLKQLPTQ